MKSKKRARRVHPELALARRVSYNAVCLLGVRVSKGLRASRLSKRDHRLARRAARRAFEKAPEKTYHRDELMQRARRRIVTIRAGVPRKVQRGREIVVEMFHANSSAKQATRELICLEHGIEYSPRKFRKLLKRLNRGEVAA